MKHLHTIPYFNSIKVQLKQPNMSMSSAMSNIFQFHKGTIKTFLGAVCVR